MKMVILNAIIVLTFYVLVNICQGLFGCEPVDFENYRKKKWGIIKLNLRFI